MKKHLSSSPYFIALLPIFYLLHLTNEYYPILKAGDLLAPVSIWLIGIPVVLYCLLRFVNPALVKYALPVFFLELAYFFFGSLQDFFKDHLLLLSRYSILIPLLLVIALIILVMARKPKTSSGKYFFYLNTLGLVFTVMELARSIAITGTDGQARFWFRSREPIAASFICDTCAKPDIYFIIFDGYAGSGSLQKYWQYDNKQSDSFFRSQGFYYASRSSSNYNSTPYSIGSILNMDYHLKTPDKKLDVLHFCQAIETIETNKVCRLLQQNHYAIRDLSCFPVLDQQPALSITFLNDKKKILIAQTFGSRAWADIGWHFHFLQKLWSTDQSMKQIIRGRLNFQQVQKAHTTLLQTSLEPTNGPVFVYAHFFLPHDPYFYDSTGKITPESTWFPTGPHKEQYLAQLKYTNTLIREVAMHLRTEGNRPRIIIIQSDHGYRSFSNDLPQNPESYQHLEFSNLNAIYFPDQDYTRLYDSVSSVNTFRIIFNKYLHTQIPLLKDSTVYIHH